MNQEPQNTQPNQSDETPRPLDESGIGESLESVTPDQAQSGTTGVDNTGQLVSPQTPAQPPGQNPKHHRLRAVWQRLNIYLLLFALLLVASGIIVTIAILKNGKTAPATISNQTLSEQALKQLANTGTTVGDPKQVLNVQSNAVFAGSVLFQKDLDVAGTIKVGGSLTLPGINVSGSSVFNQLQAKKLSIAGDTAINGQLTVQKSLSVNGSGTFNGPVNTPQLTANSLQLSGDLILTHHINAGGPIPGRSNGGALGAGGTSSVSGSDTAGSISIRTGSNPAAGCFITVNFVRSFASTPHVVVSPIGAAAGRLQYYVNRSTGSFSVCTASAASGGQSFGFDYIVFD